MNNDQLVNSIVKGFAYAENGGAPDISNPKSGKTGEMKSIFQFTPATWKQDAKKYLGNENVPISPDVETYVMQQKVKDWIKQGYTVSQMASVHNAGASEPNAYTGKFSDGSSSVGVNPKYGVKFDVPDYAKKVVNYSKQFYQDKTSPTNQQTNSEQPEQLKSVLSLIQQAGKAPQVSSASTISVQPISTQTA